jgi:hypothetical protein
MKHLKRWTAWLLAVALLLSMGTVSAFAKTNPTGQTVETVLFYVRNQAGEDILVSAIPVTDMESDLANGVLDDTNHNYSLLDRYVTTVHQEAQGFTVAEFVEYAQQKSTVASLRDLDLTFTGSDQIAFWEIDQTGFDDQDTYTYDELYGQARYNFPLLYQYWNYRTQDYEDPAGVMTREEVIDYILQNGEPETVLLSVRAFSQRYMNTDEKYSSGDYNLENYWQSQDLLDNERTIRVMKPMTEEELRNKTSTASDSRYWVANLRLAMAEAPDIDSLGTVAAPTATMTEDADNYYITFQCATEGATILYNANYGSPSYTPACAYTGEAVVIPKSSFPGGTVTMTCRAVKEGYTDAGVTTLALTAQTSYTDVATGAWYESYVQYVTEHGYFDSTAPSTFSPNAPMTRAMLATALYRMAGQPAVTTAAPFTDVAATADYADAVAWAYDVGVVNGISDTTFAPDATITREQIVTMFCRYAALVAGRDVTAAGDLSAFTDSATVAAWAADQMTWAVSAGLIEGTTATTLSPKATATRAQTAALVQRLDVWVG